jgi:hypothetical protein
LFPASRDKANGSCVWTQFSWVLLQDPRFLNFRFLNIINCIINIIIFNIIQSINIKHIIICVVNIIIFIIIIIIIMKNSIVCVINIIISIIINSINIKNSIICVINIIISIIINIINNFEKTLLLILKNNHRFDLKGKIIIIILGLWVRTLCSWVRHQDPRLMNPLSVPNFLGSFFRTQSSWVLGF